MIHNDLDKLCHNDLDKLCQWTTKWLMFFNIDKCKILHIGEENPKFDYSTTDKDGNVKNFLEVECEKDLGIYVQSNLIFNKHINLTVNRANISCLDIETLLILYKILICPILDNGNLIWYPSLKKDIGAIENVRRRITKKCYRNYLN